MLASRNPYWMPFSLQGMILIILLMLTMSALFSGLNLSFTSVAISELNIITRMGDAYVCFFELIGISHRKIKLLRTILKHFLDKIIHNQERSDILPVFKFLSSNFRKAV